MGGKRDGWIPWRRSAQASLCPLPLESFIHWQVYPRHRAAKTQCICVRWTWGSAEFQIAACLQQEPQVPFLQVRLLLQGRLAVAAQSSHGLCAPYQGSELGSLSRTTLFCFWAFMCACSLVFLFRLQEGIHTFFHQPRVMEQKAHSTFTKGAHGSSGLLGSG